VKPSTVIVIVVTILLLAGLTVWVVLAQARNTLSQAEKTAKVAGDVSSNVKDIIGSGRKIWDDASSWLEEQNG
jgi:hypothetical protein